MSPPIETCNTYMSLEEIQQQLVQLDQSLDKNEKDMEQNATSLEDNAKLLETNAKRIERKSKQYDDEAHIDESILQLYAGPGNPTKKQTLLEEKHRLLGVSHLLLKQEFQLLAEWAKIWETKHLLLDSKMRLSWKEWQYLGDNRLPTSLITDHQNEDIQISKTKRLDRKQRRLKSKSKRLDSKDERLNQREIQLDRTKYVLDQKFQRLNQLEMINRNRRHTQRKLWTRFSPFAGESVESEDYSNYIDYGSEPLTR